MNWWIFGLILSGIGLIICGMLSDKFWLIIMGGFFVGKSIFDIVTNENKRKDPLR